MNAQNFLLDTGINAIGIKVKKRLSLIGSGIALTNNEIKDIIKVIKSLEKRDILLKGTTKKIINQKRRFFGLLMRVEH